MQEAETQGQLFRSLAKLREWDALANVLREQANDRTGQVLNSIASLVEGSQMPAMGLEGPISQPGLDGFTMVMKQEFEKGIRSGLLMTIDLPRALGEHHAQRAQELRAEILLVEEERELQSEGANVH